MKVIQDYIKELPALVSGVFSSPLNSNPISSAFCIFILFYFALEIQ